VPFVLPISALEIGGLPFLCASARTFDIWDESDLSSHCANLVKRIEVYLLRNKSIKCSAFDLRTGIIKVYATINNATLRRMELQNKDDCGNRKKVFYRFFPFILIHGTHYSSGILHT